MEENFFDSLADQYAAPVIPTDAAAVAQESIPTTPVEPTVPEQPTPTDEATPQDGGEPTEWDLELDTPTVDQFAAAKAMLQSRYGFDIPETVGNVEDMLDFAIQRSEVNRMAMTTLENAKGYRQANDLLESGDDTKILGAAMHNFGAAFSWVDGETMQEKMAALEADPNLAAKATKIGREQIQNYIKGQEDSAVKSAQDKVQQSMQAKAKAEADRIEALSKSLSERQIGTMATMPEQLRSQVIADYRSGEFLKQLASDPQAFVEAYLALSKNPTIAKNRDKIFSDRGKQSADLMLALQKAPVTVKGSNPTPPAKPTQVNKLSDFVFGEDDSFYNKK